jgi:hypothetical protein
MGSGLRERRYQALLRFIGECFGSKSFTVQELYRQLKYYSGEDSTLKELSKSQVLRVRRLLQRLAKIGYLTEIKGAGRNANVYKLLFGQDETVKKEFTDSDKGSLMKLDSSDFDGDSADVQLLVSFSIAMKNLRRREAFLLKELSEVRSLIKQCESKILTLLKSESIKLPEDLD